jgi:hypothetical protein
MRRLMDATVRATLPKRKKDKTGLGKFFMRIYGSQMIIFSS